MIFDKIPLQKKKRKIEEYIFLLIIKKNIIVDFKETLCLE